MSTSPRSVQDLLKQVQSLSTEDDLSTLGKAISAYATEVANERLEAFLQEMTLKAKAQPEPEIIDISGLAARWHTTVDMLRKLRCQSPERMPQPLAIGGRKLLWRIADVRAWEGTQSESRQAPRSGRKSVAQKARDAVREGR